MKRLLAAALPLLFGCAAGANLRTIGAPADNTSAATVTAAPAPEQAAGVQGMRRWLDVLETAGVIPLNVEVLDGALDPIAGATVRVVDATLERYGATTGDDGIAHLQVPTVALARWEILGTDGSWHAVSRPQITPDKSGMGLRAVIVLEAPAPPPQDPARTSAPVEAITRTALEAAIRQAFADGDLDRAASLGRQLVAIKGGQQ